MRSDRRSSRIGLFRSKSNAQRPNPGYSIGYKYSARRRPSAPLGKSWVDFAHHVRDLVRRRELFLSHASRDRAFVERLARVLDANGIPYFYNKRHIAGARQWHDELGVALERCNWFILILTPESIKSVWVKRELLFALQSKKYQERIVPVLLKNCSVNKLSWTLPSFQHVDFRRSFKVGTAALLRTLEVPPRRSNKNKK
jgi:hypothetical protein